MDARIANLSPRDGEEPLEIRVIRKWISYGKGLNEITCSCFHGFVDKDLINLVIPDVKRYVVVLTGIYYHLKELRYCAQCLIEDEDFIKRSRGRLLGIIFELIRQNKNETRRKQEGPKLSLWDSTRCRRIVGNKMHKAFPLPGIEFPLAEEVPTASEEGCHCQKKREATARKIALLSKSR
nr:ribonuclease H-like domain-containing protein [Tanacetum cinerariifolium]